MTRLRDHFGPLIRLGFPIVVGNIGIVITGLADTWMIGRHSTEELAASAFVNNMFMLVLVFCLGFTNGLTPLAGKHYAKGEWARVGVLTKNSLWANLSVGLLSMAVLLGIYMRVEDFGQPVELLPLIRPYLMVMLLSMPFVMIFNTFKQFCDAITRTRTPMWLLVAGNVLNIFGNYALIYGHWGAPEMGLLGAGISTFAARLFMALAMMVLFFTGKSYRPYRAGFWSEFCNRSDFVRLNVIGWPVALQLGMETAAFALSSVMVGWLGKIELAAHQIVLTMSSAFYMIYIGVGAAVAVRVSHFQTMRDDVAVRQNARAGFLLVLLIALAISIPVLLLRNDLGRLFTDDSRVWTVVAATVWPVIIYQFGDGLQTIYGNALRGLAHVRPLVWSAFVAYFVVSLPLSYVLGHPFGFGLVGIWSAFPVGLTTAGVLYYAYFIFYLHRSSASETRG